MVNTKKITTTDANLGEWWSVEYATICPFSKNNKWLILQHALTAITNKVFEYGLFTGDGVFVRTLSIAHNAEPRWSRTLQDVLYYIDGNKIMQMDVNTGSLLVFHTFPEYVEHDSEQRNGVSGLGEGDIEGTQQSIQLGSSWWALTGLLIDGSRDIFMYDVTKDNKLAALRVSAQNAHDMDNVYVTPTGNVQISWVKSGTATNTGIELYNGNLATFKRHLANVAGHNDVGQFNGKDVLIWCSSADPVINSNSVIMIDNTTGKTKTLMTLIWPYALHISCCDKEYCAVSTYDITNTNPSQVWQVPFNGPAPELLCNTDAVYFGYNDSPRATLSRDGSRFVYTSNGNVFIGIIPDTPDVIPVPPIPVIPPDTDTGNTNPCVGSAWSEIDFAANENQEWIWKFKVVNGKMTVKVYDKVKS